MIQTNERMIDKYKKHTAQLRRFANAKTELERNEILDNWRCYMCSATHASDFYDELDECGQCPLNKKLQSNYTCSYDLRLMNLRNSRNLPISNYRFATPESIRKHADWIEEQIAKFTF